jgi:hypothetical protein
MRALVLSLMLLAAPAGAQSTWAPTAGPAQPRAGVPAPADDWAAYARKHYRDQRRSAEERGVLTRAEKRRLKNEARFIRHQGD